MGTTLLVVGIASLALAGVHLVGGGREVLRPMLAAPMDSVARETMHVCWHGISAQLALSGLALVALASTPSSPLAPGVLATTSVLYLAYALLFVAIGVRSDVVGAWYKLGQWMAFLPLGIAGVVALA